MEMFMSIDRRWKKECLPILITILKLLMVKNKFTDLRSRTNKNKDNGRNTMSIQYPFTKFNMELLLFSLFNMTHLGDTKEGRIVEVSSSR